MTPTARITVLSALLVVLSGCGGASAPDTSRNIEGDPGTVIGDEEDRFTYGFGQCEDHQPAYAETDPAVDLTLNNHVGPGQTVHCVDSKTFRYEGRDIHFTYAAYGELNDCPAGCFSNQVCAIVDQDQSYLYSQTEYRCEVAPCANNPEDGKNHPLTQSKTFKEFIEAQREDLGSYRFCL
jgi:hypothetical protein